MNHYVKLFFMKKNLLVILLCCSSIILQAQNTWEPGYIILQEQDSVSGFILERTDAEMAHAINFKKQGEIKTLVYKAKEIAGFGFKNGRVYESHSFVNESGEKIYVFAKSLVRGKLDLFAWRHPQRLQPDFFLVNNKSGKSVYLKKPVKKEIIGKDGKRYNQRDKNYIGNLKLVKEDSLTADIRFSEKIIQKEIIQYNGNYASDFPLLIHEERVDNSIDVLAGVPIQFSTGFSNFRVAVYLNKSKPERSTNFVITRGIIYNHHVNDQVFPADFKDGKMSHKAQMLNLVPFAIKFQGSSKIFQPYGYAGAGIAVVKETNLLVKDYHNNGTESNFFPIPTVNIGMGARLKLGPAYLVTELTPTLQGIFLNTGISF